MTVPTARLGARLTLWASLAWNGGIVVANVVRGRYEAGAFALIVVGVLATWLWLVPKIDGWLDARLAEAIAQKTSAEIVLAEVQRLQRHGELQIGVSIRGAPERMH